jgi:hypothetical protein
VAVPLKRLLVSDQRFDDFQPFPHWRAASLMVLQKLDHFLERAKRVA